MIKILKNIYFFTKLSTSLLLLFIILVLLFIFYKSYLGQEENKNDLLKKTTEIYQKNINKEFNKQNKQISDFSLKIENLENKIKKINNEKNDNNLKDEIANLKKDYNKLLKQQSEKKSNSNQKNKFEFNQKHIVINNYLNSIEISIEKGLDFNETIYELLKIVEKNEIKFQLEKILKNSTNIILSYDEIGDDFDYISNIYLKNYLLKNSNNSYFYKYFLEFFSLSTDLKSRTKNKNVEIISITKKFLNERKIDLAISELSKIDDEEGYFNEWIKNAKNYNNSLSIIISIREDLKI